MLNMRQHFEKDGTPTKLEILGDAEPTTEFSLDFLRDSDAQYLDWTDEVITLRDDNGRIIRYRVTGEVSAPIAVSAELIES